MSIPPYVQAANDIVRLYYTAPFIPPIERTPLVEQIKLLAYEGYLARLFKPQETENQFFQRTFPHKSNQTAANKKISAIAYAAQVRKSREDYMIRHLTELAHTVLHCVPVTTKSFSNKKRFCYINPQEYSGDMAIADFLELIIKVRKDLEKMSHPIAHHLVVTKVFFWFMQGVIHVTAKGKTVNIWGDINGHLSIPNYRQIFTNNQPYCSSLVTSQFRQLENAVLAGKTTTDEPTPQDAIEFTKWSAEHPVIKAPLFSNTSFGGGGVPIIGGMAINTAWNPSGNAPSMVPMVPGSGSPWGYQSGL